MSVNKCMFIGRVGKTPEIREINDNFKVAAFSLACGEKWTDKDTGEKKENTEWISCDATNRVAEVVERYVKKGDLLYIEGKFKTQKWEKDGKTMYKSYIQVSNLEMLTSRTERQTPAENATVIPNNISAPRPVEESEYQDLPF